MHENDRTKRIGWPQELMATGHFMNSCERGQLPRLRVAVSRVQLTWLDKVLQDAVH